MKIDVVKWLNCSIVTLHSATATVLLKPQRRQDAKGRPFGTPAVAKDCVFIIVFWLFLRINLKPQTLNVKLSKLPLTFAYCLLPTAYCQFLQITYKLKLYIYQVFQVFARFKGVFVTILVVPFDGDFFFFHVNFGKCFYNLQKHF